MRYVISDDIFAFILCCKLKFITGQFIFRKSGNILCTFNHLFGLDFKINLSDSTS